MTRNVTLTHFEARLARLEQSIERTIAAVEQRIANVERAFMVRTDLREEKEG